MRPRAIGLVAALVAAALIPATATSQGRDGKVDAKAKAQGMAEAPAVVQQLGLSCQVADARFIGKAEDRKADTTTSFYEVDCATGVGYILQAVEGKSPTAFSCIEANTPPAGQKEAALPCILPGNADPKADLAPLLQKAGVQCTPTDARGIGQSSTNTYLEVACQEGSGFVLVASAPVDSAKDVSAQNCLAFDDADTNIKCTLTEKASRLAALDRFVAQADNSCAVKDRRYIGAATDGAEYFETSCQDGKGYIYKIDNGQLAQTWGCAQAQNILGGCTLTDARQAATEQAALYSRLASTAGFQCDVDKYALFPMRGDEEVVELVCKDGKGAIGIFPATGKGEVLECGRALAAGYKCSLGKVDYAGLTADLRKFDQKTCTVSDARPAAKTAKGTTLIEVACSDGFKGYMIEYKTAPTVTAVAATGCAFAGNCQLPTNK